MIERNIQDLYNAALGFLKTGEIVVGEVAKRQAVTNVDRTISSVNSAPPIIAPRICANRSRRAENTG